MDYKKKYNDALERAREFQKSKDGLCVLTAESIFPELKESEDEKMWKLIKKYAHCNISAMALNADNISRKELETWLEKQGTNINVDSILEKIGVKPAYLDGNSWCILHGDNIQNGICGFGYTKEEALIEFLKDLLEKQSQKSIWSEEDERLRNSCIKHIEEELEEIRKDKFGHSEIISDLKESCRERINWLKSLKKDWFEKQGEQKLKE